MAKLTRIVKVNLLLVIEMYHLWFNVILSLFFSFASAKLIKNIFNVPSNSD